MGNLNGPILWWWNLNGKPQWQTCVGFISCHNVYRLAICKITSLLRQESWQSCMQTIVRTNVICMPALVHKCNYHGHTGAQTRDARSLGCKTWSGDRLMQVWKPDSAEQTGKPVPTSTRRTLLLPTVHHWDGNCHMILASMLENGVPAVFGHNMFESKTLGLRIFFETITEQVGAD